ncbi:MAG: acetylesterase [Oscillospiraceae bacterium]|nr:acetylesterase [Oscillospiraceae bacterium]
MALIQFTYVSSALLRSVPVQVILPVDKLDPEGNYLPLKKYKTLYLLHGILGSHVDWVSGTRIQRWAEERDLAVVMPSGENSFYIDRPGFHTDYGRFIGEELVQITRRMFPLSEKREDTFIGGLSMGGFGAMRNGLKYRETFSRIISLSPALHLFEGGPDLFAGFLGKGLEQWEEIVNSDLNPRWLLGKLGEEKPGVYLACGDKDDLLPGSRLYRRLLTEAGVELHYVEDAGGHEWDYWDRHIRLALDWLPLDQRSGGLNSGNIKGE